MKVRVFLVEEPHKTNATEGSCCKCSTPQLYGKLGSLESFVPYLATKQTRTTTCFGSREDESSPQTPQSDTDEARTRGAIALRGPRWTRSQGHRVQKANCKLQSQTHAALNW